MSPNQHSRATREADCRSARYVDGVSLALKVLLALVSGFLIGLGISGSGSPTLSAIIPIVEPVGTLWVAALRMTIIPLVVASLIVGVGGAPNPKSVGQVGMRAMLLITTLLCVTSFLAVIIAPPIMARISIDPAAAESLRATAVGAGASAVEGAKKLPSVAQWIIDLVPVNPVKAAADGAMLPLILFAVAFGAALTRIAEDRRAAVMQVMQGIQDVMLEMVRFILDLAPIGVFALAVSLAAKLGLSAAGAVIAYIGFVVVATILLNVFVLYPAAVLLGGISLGDFARAALPPQAVAFSSRSSMAALPAMLESARDRLGMEPGLAGFILPLAVTTFRCGASIGLTVGAIFIARLYGIELGAGQLALMAITTVVTSFSIPGIPGGSIIMMVPVLLAAGIPAEGAGLLLAVDTIPDMFRTTTNVTGDMVAAVILSKGQRQVVGE
jgi:proton glutamate symport protein